MKEISSTDHRLSAGPGSARIAVRSRDRRHRPLATEASILRLACASAIAAVASGANAMNQSVPSPSPSIPRTPGMPVLSPGGAVGAVPAASDVVRLAPAGIWRGADGRIHLGVRFTLAPKWHIYWSNPGDSGLPPRITATLPTDWKLGATMYPRPDIIRANDETNFGYDERVVLLVPLEHSQATANSKSPTPPKQVTLEVRYLVCKEVCLAGTGSVKFEIPDPEALARVPMVPEVIEGRSIPKSLTAVGGRATVENGRLRITGPGSIVVPSTPSPSDDRGADRRIEARLVRFLPFELPGFTLTDAPFAEGRSSGEGFEIDLPVKLDPNDAPAQVLYAGGLVTVGPGCDDPCFEFRVQESRISDRK